MKKNFQIHHVLILCIGILLTSCEKQQLLRSSSKVEKELEATWQKIDMTSQQSHISWRFSEGKVSLIKHGEVLAMGDYSVDVGTTRIYISTSNFPEPGYDYMNGKWKVLTLDGHALVIAGSYSGGVLESEFTK